MSLAIDFGSSGFRSISRCGRRLRGRKVPAFYLAVPDQPGERRLLERMHVPYCCCDDALIVMGQHAVDLARSLRLPLIPVLPDGRLPEGDPVGRQVAAQLIESLIPGRGVRAGVAGVILPGDPVSPETADPLYGFIQRLLTLRGYRPVLVNAGTACVLTELEHRAFRGIGLSVGAASTSMSLSHRGRALWQGAVRRGNNQVDVAFAHSRGRFVFDSHGNRYLDLDAVAAWRTAAPINLAAPGDADEELLQSLCREWLATAFREFGRRLEESEAASALPETVALVIAGGPSRMTGFDHLVVETLRAARFPIGVDEVRSARTCDFTLARGALLAAELESRSAARSA